MKINVLLGYGVVIKLNQDSFGRIVLNDITSFGILAISSFCLYSWR